MKHLPDAKKLHSDIHRKGLFEPLALLPSIFVVACVHSISEGNLLAIPCWKQADLDDVRAKTELRLSGLLTLCIIPANARAVYAPREKPKMHILSFVRSGGRMSLGRVPVSLSLQFSIKNS